ncbi:hypothetical protein L1987_39584 [Smallanthus sonchifolius]|uniref:Uncharacterized protein n=1 Tax=Smallanthus sonchifolius TaxID=185202 RepID=A0ACB9HM67_9ASTR|nr:hypothetical protein L1987_39584 [Smallanthus sonchifolius]
MKLCIQSEGDSTPYKTEKKAEESSVTITSGWTVFVGVVHSETLGFLWSQLIATNWRKKHSLNKYTMASSSSSHLDHNVDDSYFLALHDDADGIFPISDEKYAEELQLQEALISSSLSLILSPIQNASTVSYASSSKQPSMTLSQVPHSPHSLCAICMDAKTASEMFQNTKVCAHLFCSDCIREYVAAKIKENVTAVRCPDPNCEGVIGPHDCGSIVPKQVLERWESILCESLIVGTQKFHCPFKDCSAISDVIGMPKLQQTVLCAV